MVIRGDVWIGGIVNRCDAYNGWTARAPIQANRITSRTNPRRSAPLMF